MYADVTDWLRRARLPHCTQQEQVKQSSSLSHKNTNIEPTAGVSISHSSEQRSCIQESRRVKPRAGVSELCAPSLRSVNFERAAQYVTLMVKRAMDAPGNTTFSLKNWECISLLRVLWASVGCKICKFLEQVSIKLNSACRKHVRRLLENYLFAVNGTRCKNCLACKRTWCGHLNSYDKTITFGCVSIIFVGRWRFSHSFCWRHFSLLNLICMKTCPNHYMGHLLALKLSSSLKSDRIVE